MAEIGNRVMIVMNIKLEVNSDLEIEDRDMFVGEQGTITDIREGRKYPYVIEFDNREKVELSKARGNDWVWCDDEILVL